MKTLDEVIKKYEMCSSQITCSTCPYYQEICSCDPDALHYLKEFKRYRLATQKNEPLTWDELKLMEGRPVWVEWVEVVIGGSYSIRDWFLIEWIDNNNHEAIIRDRHGNQILYRDGSDWQIYRKEHK